MASTNQSNRRPIIIWIIVFCLSFFGWIFSIVAAASCNFVVVGSLGLGLFSTGYIGSTCVSYGETADGAHGAAKAFGVVAAVFSGVIFFLLFSMLFWKIPMILHRVIAGGFTFVTVCQLLTLLFVKTTNDFGCAGTGVCFLGAAGVMAVMAAIFFLPCAVLLFIYPPPERKIIGSFKSQTPMVGPKQQQGSGGGAQQIAVVNPDGSISYQTPEPAFQNEGLAGGGAPPGVPQEQTTYETINPDGTKTLTVVTEYADGSKTMQETVVPATGGEQHHSSVPPSQGAPPPVGLTAYSQTLDPEGNKAAEEYVAPPPPGLHSEGAGGGSEETRYESMNPDGTMTVMIVREHPDGSKTVTENVVPTQQKQQVDALGGNTGARLQDSHRQSRALPQHRPPAHGPGYSVPPPGMQSDEGMEMMRSSPTPPPAEAEVSVEPVASVPIIEAANVKGSLKRSPGRTKQ